MSDSEIRRLEDRIEAVNREGQLRLDLAMTRIEGAIGRIEEQNSSIHREVHGQRDDTRALRATVDQQKYWVIGTGVAVALGLGALVVGVKQIWIAGVQTGQVIQSAPAGTTASPSGQRTH
jgi:hypothetical protein